MNEGKDLEGMKNNKKKQEVSLAHIHQQ